MRESLLQDARECGASWAMELINRGGSLDYASEEALAAADAYVKGIKRERLLRSLTSPIAFRGVDVVRMREEFLGAAHGTLDRAKNAIASASETHRRPGEPDKASAAIRTAIDKSRRSAARRATRKYDGSMTQPVRQEFGVSHEGAERLVSAWLRFLGVEDAEPTRFTKDGGVDIESAEFVVQVKHQQGKVTSKDVQAIAGIAASSSRRAVFFTSSSYTRDAESFSDNAGVALFTFDPEGGTCQPVNEIAERTPRSARGR